MEINETQEFIAELQRAQFSKEKEYQIRSAEMGKIVQEAEEMKVKYENDKSMYKLGKTQYRLELETRHRLMFENKINGLNMIHNSTAAEFKKVSTQYEDLKDQNEDMVEKYRKLFEKDVESSKTLAANALEIQHLKSVLAATQEMEHKQKFRIDAQNLQLQEKNEQLA